MVRIGTITLVSVAFLLAASLPASALRWIDTRGLAYPGAPRPVADDKPAAPYAMNYAEEAAETLGFRHGHMDVFQAKPIRDNDLTPTFSGGLGGDGAMFKMQWRPGE